MSEQDKAREDLIDPIDGENLAVRAFLCLFDQSGITVGRMRDHMGRCGFDGAWPEWVSNEQHDAHLSKSGAQDWLRHLFGLEDRRSQPEWLPIESAPKDGTVIWAFNGEQQRMKWIEGKGYALWAHAEEVLSDIDPEPDQPTYFMPLPAAPQPPIAGNDGREG